MLRKLWNSWLAAKQSFKGTKPEGILLNAKQIQAFIDLQACHLIRHQEIYLRFPEISFLLLVLREDGDDWEWFPDLHNIKQDLGLLPYNYLIISHDAEADIANAHIQLITPGLRKKSSREAIVKARVSIYNIKTTDDVQSFMNDLNDI